MIRRGRRLPFVVLPWAVLEHPDLSATDVLVYATIARYADNETGQAYPSRSTISIMARCSTDTVDRSIKALIEADFLSVEKRRTTAGGPASNLYTVHEIAAAPTARAGGGSRTHAARGSRTDAAWGSRTHAARTRPTELEPADTSEWTPPPADVKAKMAQLGLKGTA